MSRSEPGDDTSHCCDQTCIGFACPENYALKSWASTTSGDDQDTCCDQMCSGFKCPIGYRAKPGVSWRLGNDQVTCCEEQDRVTATEDAWANPVVVAAAIFSGLIGIVLVLGLFCFYRQRCKTNSPAVNAHDDSSRGVPDEERGSVNPSVSASPKQDRIAEQPGLAGDTDLKPKRLEDLVPYPPVGGSDEHPSTYGTGAYDQVEKIQMKAETAGIDQRRVVEL